MENYIIIMKNMYMSIDEIKERIKEINPSYYFIAYENKMHLKNNYYIYILNNESINLDILRFNFSFSNIKTTFMDAEEYKNNLLSNNGFMDIYEKTN